MHVFITGASGFIGTAVTKDLIAHGHAVLGLVRSETNAAAITALGATPLRGDLTDLDSLKKGATMTDGVIHLGFVHDFANMENACQIDRTAITTMGEVLAGTGKPFVHASGSLIAQPAELADEDTPEVTEGWAELRARSTKVVQDLAKNKGVRAVIIRFAPIIHADGRGGFPQFLIEMAKGAGKAVYINDGNQRWPACYRDDAAVLVRLAFEKGRAGANYNAITEEGVKVKDIAAMIGRVFKLPVESRTVEEAASTMGMFATIMATTGPASSQKTRKELGWQTSGPGVLEDYETCLTKQLANSS